MKCAIYKYLIPIPKQTGMDSVATIKLPREAVILRLENQGGVPTLWAMVDPEENRTEDVQLLVLLTGEQVDQNDLLRWKYISTAILQPDYVLHFFLKRFDNPMLRRMERFA